MLTTVAVWLQRVCSRRRCGAAVAAKIPAAGPATRVSHSNLSSMTRTTRASKDASKAAEQTRGIERRPDRGSRKNRAAPDTKVDKVMSPLCTQSPTPKVRESRHSAVRKAWSELYEKHIFNNVSKVVDTVADQFMEFGAAVLDRHAIVGVIQKVRAGYYDNNYHNFEHAAHVVINCAFMLKHVVCELSVLEQLSLLYSALIHDVGHLGVPNVTLVQKKHQLAEKFHDQSVAENNSLHVGLDVLKLQEFNLLAKFSPEDRVQFRKNVIEIVLATDVADTYKKKLTFLKLEDLSVEDAGLNTSTPAGRLAMLCIIMRACDVASSMQSVHTSEVWSRNFFLEVSLASYDTEDILREESKKYFNAQIIYMEGHSLILVVKLQTTQALRPEFTDILLQNFQSNLSNWREHGLDLLNSWTAEAVRNMQKNGHRARRLS